MAAVTPRATCSPSRSASRSRNSPAARTENVKARISHGRAAPVCSNRTIRWISVLVLPAPGPAISSSGPGPCWTACVCSGVSPSSSASSRGRAGGGWAPAIGCVISHLLWDWVVRWIWPPVRRRSVSWRRCGRPSASAAGLVASAEWPASVRLTRSRTCTTGRGVPAAARRVLELPARPRATASSALRPRCGACTERQRNWLAGRDARILEADFQLAPDCGHSTSARSARVTSTSPPRARHRSVSTPGGNRRRDRRERRPVTGPRRVTAATVGRGARSTTSPPWHGGAPRSRRAPRSTPAG